MLRLVAALLITFTCGGASIPAAVQSWTQIQKGDQHAPVIGEWTGDGRQVFGAIAVDDERMIVVVGANGSVLKSLDAGATWAPRYVATTSDLVAVAALRDHTKLVAVGADGTIVRSPDAGDTWLVQNAMVGDALTALVALEDGSTLIAVGSQGTVIRSRDGGMTWDTVSSKISDDLYAVAYVEDKKAVIAVGANGVVIRSNDVGATWERLASGTRVDLLRLATTGTVLLAFGSDGAMLQSDNGGETWTTLKSGPDPPMRVWAALVHERTIVAGGPSGRLVVSHDAGATWQAVASGTGLARRAIVGLAGGKTLVALGDGLSVSRSIDAGVHWVSQPRSEQPSLLAIAALSDQESYVAVGYNGAVVRSGDAGVTWQPVDSGVEQALLTVVASPDGQTVIAAGWDGVVILSHDGGRTWTRRPTGTPFSLTNAAVSPDGSTIVIVGGVGTVLRSTDAGNSWDIWMDWRGRAFLDVTALPDRRSFVAVGVQGVVALSNDLGQTWEEGSSGQLNSLMTVRSLVNGALVAGGENGTLLRSEDGGKTWMNQVTRTNEVLRQAVPLPDGKTTILGASGTLTYSADGKISWEQSSQSLPSKAVPLSEGHAIIGVNSGIFFRSENAGAVWDSQIVNGSPFLNAIAASPDGHTLVAVGNYGAIFRSSDGGDQWEKRSSFTHQDLVSLATLPDGQILVAVGRNGLILRSRDGGVSWQGVRGEAWGPLLQVKVLGNGRTLLALGPSVQLRSDDGGESWARLTARGPAPTQWIQPLPNTATVLGLRDAGRVVMSEDDGASWTALSSIQDRRLSSLVALADGRTVLALDADMNQVWISDTAGKTWSNSFLPYGKTTALAVLANGRSVFAVGLHGFIARSDDLGKAWFPQFNRDARNLNGAAEALGRLVAVGYGFVTQASASKKAVAAEKMRLQAADDVLTVSWQYPPGPVPECSTLLFKLNTSWRTGYEVVSSTLRQLPAEDGSSGYEVTWNPLESVHAAEGSEFSYAVACRDRALNVTWTQELPGVQRYHPSPSWSSRVWTWINQRSSIQILLLAATTSLLLWFTGLLILYIARPAWLVNLHEVMVHQDPLNHVIEAADKGALGGLARLVFALLEVSIWLGRSTRAIDAWLKPRMGTIRERFAIASASTGRRVTVDLPILINGVRREQPWEAIDALFDRDSEPLLISGPGGAGKTTLACRIGARLAENSSQSGRNCLSVPLLIERDLEPLQTGDKFPRFLVGLLRTMLGQAQLSTVLALKMLRTGRVVVIVDGLSERSKETVDAFDPTTGEVAIRRLIMTSRNRQHEHVYRTVEIPGIPPGDLYAFLDSYNMTLAEEDGAVTRLRVDQVHEACALLSRLLNDKPTTPFLAALWSEEVARGGANAATKIKSIAGLIDTCIDAMLAIPARNPEAVASLRHDAEEIASLALGRFFMPRHVRYGDALSALRARDEIAVEYRLAQLLASRLVEVEALSTLSNAPVESRWVHIALDPISEFLVARKRLRLLDNDLPAWEVFMQDIESSGCPSGFLDALLDCLEHVSPGRTIPVSIRDSIRSLRAGTSRTSLSAFMPKSL